MQCKTKFHRFFIICCFSFIMYGCTANNAANNISSTNSISSADNLLSDSQGDVVLAASGSQPAYTYYTPQPAYTYYTPQPLTLSIYRTEFKGSTAGRANNIKVGANYIDGKIVQPGETFSFNETVGPTNRWRGFKLARIFSNGKDAEGYGGGICQVSSTLYNAALEAGLEIVERHPHSKKVYYVPDDKDAATSYGYIDLKFTNNNFFPVRINSTVEQSTLSVAIEAV